MKVYIKYNTNKSKSFYIHSYLMFLRIPTFKPSTCDKVVTYILYFAFTWAWIFWRVDCLAVGQSSRVVELEGIDPSVRVSWFDYYHTSFMALLKIVHSSAQGSTFVGVSKFGRSLVTVHSFMVFDLAGIALARFYQLVQKSL